MKPRYLLDECMMINDEERKSGLYVPHNQFTYKGCTDENLLKKATSAGLVIITKDKGFILFAIAYGINIIWQDKWGDRFYVYGSKTEYLGNHPTNEVKGKTKLQKQNELLASTTPSKISMSGFDSLACF